MTPNCKSCKCLFVFITVTETFPLSVPVIRMEMKNYFPANLFK